VKSVEDELLHPAINAACSPVVRSNLNLPERHLARSKLQPQPGSFTQPSHSLMARQLSQQRSSLVQAMSGQVN
jgi:hypothetical protein